MKIAIIQNDIVWGNPAANREHVAEILADCEQVDLLVLPEMFSTGFCTQPEGVAEPADNLTLLQMKEWAAQYDCAVAGSVAVEDGGRYYNRFYFVKPNGETTCYDKHHLFRMGNETKYFSPGKNRPIIHYHGWNILLLICYDLRFPVWSRNRNNEYDMVVYVANWPAARRRVWDVMLQTRAMENSSYLCGVNRIGMDGNNLFYNGGSAIYSPKGELLANVADNVDGVATATLSLNELKSFREKFPVWKDADSFTLL